MGTDMAANNVPSRAARRLAFAGALLAGAAVALWAYAEHGAGGAARAALLSAAAIAFGHGVALAALSRLPQRRLGFVALGAMAAGALLFSGGILVAHLAGVHAWTAPFGGGLLIASWLAVAVDALRR